MSFVRFVKKICLILLIVVLLSPIVVIGGRLLYNLSTNNVHTVIPAEIYRTAQLDQNGLTKYTEKLHLKTIINLRGAWPHNPWYQVESKFAKKNKLHYYAIKFSAYDLPNIKKLRELVYLLQTAPKPLAFHCEGGADRTGMAAAISLILFDKNATMTQIKRQASWHYNAVLSMTVGYQLMRNYFAWLKVHHYQSSKSRFLEWVNSPTLTLKPYHGWFIV